MLKLGKKKVRNILHIKKKPKCSPAVTKAVIIKKY